MNDDLFDLALTIFFLAPAVAYFLGELVRL